MNDKVIDYNGVDSSTLCKEILKYFDFEKIKMNLKKWFGEFVESSSLDFGKLYDNCLFNR